MLFFCLFYSKSVLPNAEWLAQVTTHWPHEVQIKLDRSNRDRCKGLLWNQYTDSTRGENLYTKWRQITRKEMIPNALITYLVCPIGYTKHEIHANRSSGNTCTYLLLRCILLNRYGNVFNRVIMLSPLILMMLSYTFLLSSIMIFCNLFGRICLVSWRFDHLVLLQP